MPKPRNMAFRLAKLGNFPGVFRKGAIFSPMRYPEFSGVLGGRPARLHRSLRFPEENSAFLADFLPRGKFTFW
jgi:hypothetical protein